MNWQKEAVNELRKYRARRQALENMAERRATLEDAFRGVRCAAADAIPVQGGANRMEDSLINNIVERERLYWTMEATRRLVELTERGLSGLTEPQRVVLEKFYIDRPSDHVGWLTEYLNVEKAQVYRIKDNALYQFTTAMYGLSDY